MLPPDVPRLDPVEPLRRIVTWRFWFDFACLACGLGGIVAAFIAWGG
jgi:hypothetical protein